MWPQGQDESEGQLASSKTLAISKPRYYRGKALCCGASSKTSGAAETHPIAETRTSQSLRTLGPGKARKSQQSLELQNNLKRRATVPRAWHQLDSQQ